MNGYLLSVVGTVLLCAVLTAILPEGKTSGVIKGVTKLACLLAIIAPIPKFLQTYSKTGSVVSGTENTQNFFPETVIQTDEDFIKYYSELRIRLTEEALQEELLKKFDVETTVSLVWEYQTDTALNLYEDSVIAINQIKIRCNEEDEEAKMAVWEYVTKNYCSEVLLE